MTRRETTGEWVISEREIKKVAAVASLVAGLLTATVSVTVAWWSAGSRVDALQTRVVSTEARLTALESGLRELSADLADIRTSVAALVRFRCIDSDEVQQRLAGIYALCEVVTPPRLRGR